MAYLLVVSFIWAFSFGLTKGKLAGLDSAFISAARLGLALLVFLPFLRLRGFSLRTGLQLTAIGAIQFGLMYLAFNESYRYLQAYEVVLFTITTPILVTLFADALDRTLRLRALAAAALAVVGTALVAVKSANIQSTLTGIALIQASNAAFAIGQVLYQRLRRQVPSIRDREVFALLYAGAAAIAVVAMLVRVDVATISVTSTQLATLLYLGILASGLGFFLWNVGATRVSTATLAVLNNAKIPLGVACSLIFFGEQANLGWLLASLALMGVALWLANSVAPQK